MPIALMKQKNKRSSYFQLFSYQEGCLINFKQQMEQKYQSKMQNNFVKRPQTSKYRNQSQIHFGTQSFSKQQNQATGLRIPKKRPQSYRNISKMSQFMSDTYVPMKQMQQVHYMNVIQNRNQRYDVPKTGMSLKNSQTQDFENFFEKTGYKMYKPVDQFTQYTDLMRKNSALLRRAQFSMPISNGEFTSKKRSENFSRVSYATSKYFTKMRGATAHTKLGNTIQGSLNQSIKQKKMLKKEKQLFAYKTQKYIKPMNKTFLGFANEYDEMMGKERQNTDKTALKNAMSRVLTMQSMGKQIKGMTQLYV